MRNSERNVIGFTALQRQHGTLEQDEICSVGRNKLSLQFTINTALWLFLAMAKETNH